MKTLLLAVGMFVVLSGQAEASMLSNGLGKAWSYLTSPVNAVTQLGADLAACVPSALIRFVRTVVDNANPKHLIE